MAWLAPALDKAHQQGIIHRDLKPGNILFDDNNAPYIADFGIAKMTKASQWFTIPGVPMGTPAYMSPEQARGELNLDGRRDIYALGAVLFKMLTGRNPYVASTSREITECHINAPIPRLDEVRIGLPAGCQAIINCAMAKEREARYPTASVLSEAVQKLLKNSIGSTMIWPKDGMTMVYVPAGSFLIGSLDSDPETREREKPPRRVYLDAFWIDLTPVTNAMFARFVAETGYRTEAEKKGYAWVWNLSTIKWDRDRWPVIGRVCQLAKGTRQKSRVLKIRRQFLKIFRLGRGKKQWVEL